MSGVRYEPGDVLDYISEREFNHCRECCAVVVDDGRAVDTFWGFPNMHGDSHVLTDRELATAGRRFRLGDYREVRHESEWLTFAPTDRQVVTSQQGLQARYYVRAGAEPSLATQIDNARAAVERAESDVRCAESTLRWRQTELARLLAASSETSA